MKTAALVAICAGLLVTVASASGKDAAKAGKAVLTPAAELKWGDVPDMKGVHVAVVQGDPQKGPSHFFIKFDGGFKAPMHHHTSDHHVTVVAGTLVLNIDGADHSLPAGSYFAFTGKKPHATTCAAGADCLLSIDSRGKWDVVPETAAAEAKKE